MLAKMRLNGKPPTKDDVIRVLRKKNYPIFNVKDFDLTMGSVRTMNGSSVDQTRDLFDDFHFVFWREHGQLQYKVWRGTTDPGRRYLNRPINPNGTAILVPGRYPGMWKKGRHGSRNLDAFRQHGVIKVYRDRDRDNYLDMAGVAIETGTGQFINHHPASYGPGRGPALIGPWGAGCMVDQEWSDFVELRRLRDLQIARTRVDSFSQCLITELDF